jgi:hypothetical protein
MVPPGLNYAVGYQGLALRFVHHSSKPLTQVPCVTQEGQDSRWSKPSGTWLAVLREDGTDPWKDYCEARGFELGPYCTEVIIKKESILHVQDANGIDNLTMKYGFLPACHEDQKTNPDYTRSGIRWDVLSREYDGIVIAPECIDRRQVDLWYYTWDVASGCIWNRRGVEKLKPLSLPQLRVSCE